MKKALKRAVPEAITADGLAPRPGPTVIIQSLRLHCRSGDTGSLSLSGGEFAIEFVIPLV
jgi:hypothetical protein